MSFLKDVIGIGDSVSLGQREGFSKVHKFGFNNAIGTTRETVWSPSVAYPWPTTTGVLQVSAGANDTGTLLSSGTSTSGTTTTLTDTGATFIADGVAAGDTVIDDTNQQEGVVASLTETEITLLVAVGTALSGAGYRVATTGSTGASVVRVLGVDADRNEISDYVIMNGATDVATTNSYYIPFRAYVVSAGSSNGNVGVVDIQDAAAANTLAEIRAAECQTEMAVWVVPAGKSLYITFTKLAEGNNVRVSGQTYWRPRGGVFRPIGFVHADQASGDENEYRVPLVIPEQADVEFRALGDGPNARVWGGFEGYYGA